MPTLLRGLTWDHQRAIAPLRAARALLAERLPDVRVTWDTQPLAGFEARAMAETVEQYDLLVFDHPHVGEAACSGLLRPFEPSGGGPGMIDADYVGRSLDSYRHGAALWGLPIDAACQVACLRPDLMARLEQPVPTDWDSVLRLGERARKSGSWLAAALGGVHSLMLLLTLCANQDAPLARAPGPAFPDDAAALRALDAMRALMALCPPEALGWNSIALQEAMRARDDLLFCPAVYGFSTYARADSPPVLRFADLPGLGANGPRGSTLGGAGIGVSARCRSPEAAESVALLLASRDAQTGVVPASGGQPAHRAAWDDAGLNADVGEFYATTRATIEAAWVRPRFAGYLSFQGAGGPLVEACLRGADPRRTLDGLQAAWERAWRVAA